MSLSVLEQVPSGVWAWIASVAFAAVVARLWAFVALCPALPEVVGGIRGSKRQMLRQSGRPGLDVALRKSGGVVKRSMQVLPPLARVWLARWRDGERRQLIWAGQPAGLDEHELMSLSVGGGLLGGILGHALGSSDQTFVWVLPGAFLGMALPHVRLQSLATDRFVEMARELPAVIDLAALSMSAGSDLPAAIRRVVQDRKGVVAEELNYFLHSLDLGVTRRAALVALRERIPVQEVKDLVRAILLADQKGTSIAEALNQQAEVGRQRRSVRAEEAAARAGVLLLFPLMLLMGCILILIMGPLVLQQGAW